MARQKRYKTPLYQIILDALKQWDDPLWLGENSLLASPYLLGAFVKPGIDVSDPGVRGQMLRELIEVSASHNDNIDLN